MHHTAIMESAGNKTCYNDALSVQSICCQAHVLPSECTADLVAFKDT